MFSGRKKSIFSIIDALKKRKRKNLYLFRVIQLVISVCVSGLFYTVPQEFRKDAITETSYPTVSMLLFFRVLTDPSAKIPFFYNLYVDTIGVGLYTIIGITDLYYGLLKGILSYNIYLHYARLYLMLLTSFLLVADVLYIEFFEKNPRLLPEKRSIGNAERTQVEISMQKYNKAIAEREGLEEDVEAAK